MAKAGGFTPSGETVIEGILYKKTPGGIKGFKPWQKRYFLVTTKAISYHKAKGDDPKGVLPILEVKKVEYLPEKRMGARFDIISKNGRTYSLHSDCEEDSHIWVNAIRQAVLLAKQEIYLEEKKQSILDDTGKKYSMLQKMFFSAKFGEENLTKNKSKEREAKMILAEIDRDFNCDFDVLKYLLFKILDPAAGYFVYDRAEEETKANDEASLTMNSSVRDVLAYVGQALNLNGVEQYAKVFDDAMMMDIRDVVNSDIPSAIPKKIAIKINQVIDNISARESVVGKMVGAAVNGTSPNDKIAQMLSDPSMIRNLVLVFSSLEVKAHGLAVRVLWAIYHATLQPSKAVSEFCSQIAVQCGGGRVSLSTKDALMSILLLGHEVIVNIEPLGNIGFHRKIKTPAAFKALFLALKESDYEIRKLALADVTALLYENLPNCELLVTGNDWQAWLMPLLTDIQKAKRNDEPIKTCYAFLVNNVTLVHYQYFLQSPKFAQVLNSSMYRIHQFGGSNRECQLVMNTLLGALVNKLAAQKSQFSTDFTKTEWVNFFELFPILKKYVFQTAYWQTLPFLGLVFDKADATAEGDEPPSSPMQQQPPADVEFETVLIKSRPNKTDRTWNSEGVEIKDFGLHWQPQDTGGCVDVELCKKVHTLFVKLQVDKFNAELAQDKDKSEKEFLLRLQNEAEFWEDSGRFLGMMKREDISKKKLFTYRRLSFLCQNWVNSESRAARERLITQLTRLKAGQSGDDDASTSPASA